MTNVDPAGINRGVSPASSIGTVYPPDETSLSDSETRTSQREFEAKWEAKIGIHLPMREETEANRDPLIFPPGFVPTQNEELMAYHKIMRNFRQRVRELEDNDSQQLEQIILRGTQVGPQQLSNTSDMDSIMRKMMVEDEQTIQHAPVSDGPRKQVSVDLDWDERGAVGSAEPNRSGRA